MRKQIRQNRENDIGRIGENEATVLRFPIGDILGEFPGAEFTLLHRRPTDEEAYPVAREYIRTDGDTLEWTIQSGDLTEEGCGECELVATQDGVIVKDEIYTTRIRRALDGNGEPPEPWESWVQEVTDAADRAEEAAAGVPEAIDAALQEAKESGEFDGEPGEDGISPTVDVTSITGGHQIEITDRDGTKSFDVMDGLPGEKGDPGNPGQPGDDGFSPSASVAKSGKITTVTITDKYGTTSAQILDGEDGTGADIIDDTAGAGDTDKTFSADKLVSDHSELLSALNDVENFVYSEFASSANNTVSISTGTFNGALISDIFIPNGATYSIKITDSNSIIPSAKMNVYYKPLSGSHVSIGSVSTGSWVDFTAAADIYGFDGYKTSITTAGNVYVEVKWAVANTNSNLDSRVKTLEAVKNANSIRTYSGNYALGASDLELGGIHNGDGKLEDSSTRMRTKDYIPAYKGIVLNSVVYFNVFEYDLKTEEYSYSTSGWKNTYTVTQDCKIKILFNSTSTSDIISGFSSETPFISLSPAVIPIDRLTDIILSGCTKYYPSVTVKSIAHRGKYGYGIGMECGASAVIAAKKYGYSICENDVALSSDGKMVMWHDSTLSKIGDSTHSVNDYTLDELKAMDFGSSYGFPGETILTFAEWIMICKKVGVECYIDFKVTGDDFTTTLAQEMVNTIKAAGMLDHVSYLNNQQKIRQYHTNARLGLLVAPTQERVTSYQTLLSAGPVFFDTDASVVTSENCSLALLNGFEMECYFVDYTNMDEDDIFDEIDRLVGCGVQGITLNIYRVEDASGAKYGLLT